MITYWFRFIDEDREPSGYVGLAIGRNIAEVFLSIDEYGDPNMVQIKRAHLGGFCLKRPSLKEEDVAIIDDDSEFEKSDYLPHWEDSGWSDPPWVKHHWPIIWYLKDARAATERYRSSGGET